MAWLYGYEYRQEKVYHLGQWASMGGFLAGVRIDYRPGEMNEDFSDLRFTDGTGVVECNYYKDECVNGDYAHFWIGVVPYFSTTVYIYWGRTDALDNSDPSIYAFYDEFNDNSIDTDKWSIVDTDHITERTDGEGHLRIFMESLNRYYAKSKVAFGPGHELTMRIRLGTAVNFINYRQSFLGFASSEITSSTGEACMIRQFDHSIRSYVRNEIDFFEQPISNITQDSWHVVTIQYFTDKIVFWVDGQVAAECIDLLPTADLYIYFISYNWLYARAWYDDIDFVRVRDMGYTVSDDEPEEPEEGEIVSYQGRGSAGDMIRDIVFRVGNPKMR